MTSTIANLYQTTCMYHPVINRTHSINAYFADKKTALYAYNAVFFDDLYKA